MLDFRERNVLITGAGRGLGRAIAQAFARAGATLALADRTLDALEEVAGAVQAPGRRVHRLAWDLRDLEQGEKNLREARDKLGGLDVLVNNAGVFHSPKHGAGAMTPASWDAVMEINLKALVFLSDAAAKIMEPQRRGVIVNMASDAGLRGAADAYGISKWGVIGYTRGLAERLAPKGIRVNAVAPGPAATTMTGCEEGVPRPAARLPLGRYSLPEEVADVVLFLASDLARAVFGQTIVVNSGNR